MYTEAIFVKCTLFEKWPSCIWENRECSRPAGTQLRAGQEVFVCAKNRPDAKNKTFLLMGIINHPRSNFLYSPAVLYSPNEISSDVCSLFKIVPVLYVARIPGGKASPATDELMRPATSLIVNFFQAVMEKKVDLQKFDVFPLPLEPRARAAKTSKQETIVEANPGPSSPPSSATATPFDQQLLLKCVESTIAKCVESTVAKILKPVVKSLDDTLKMKAHYDGLDVKIQLLLKENELLKVQLKEQKASATEFKTQYFQCAQTLAANSGNTGVASSSMQKISSTEIRPQKQPKRKTIQASPIRSSSSASPENSSTPASSPESRPNLFETFMQGMERASRKKLVKDKRAPSEQKKRRKSN